MRVGIVGSGNFASAIARFVGQNAARLPSLHSEVKMWVHDELIEGKKLTDIINTKHENVKYLRGHTLPHNVIASPDLINTCQDADILIFALPHQHLELTLKAVQGHTKQESLMCVSLIKGAKFDSTGPAFYSEIIGEALGVKDVAVLMGANVASDVARGDFVESTLACRNANLLEPLSNIFSASSFRIQKSTDVTTVEMCGALKNIVAMGAGFCDGLSLGSSSKAALLRQGLQEMAFMCKLVNPNFLAETLLFQSCGGADVIATCYGGRNRLCSEEFCRLRLLQIQEEDSRDDTRSYDKSWKEIEERLLRGQKLQGLSTCDEVMKYISANQLEAQFPLFTKVHDIARMGQAPHTLFDW